MVDGGWRMKEYKDFQAMEVWISAQNLAVEVYQDFAMLKDYSFCDQIKRMVVSIFNNIAEGSERTTSVEFSRFLDIAKGSVGEIKSMYFLASRLGFVAPNIADIRSEKCKSISCQLGGFTKFLRNK